MANRNYLVGTRKEKEKIERLLMRNQPSLISYEYASLCSTFADLLYEEKAVRPSDFDYVLKDFIADIETDIRERLSQFHTDFSRFLFDVSDSMQYFRHYLEQLDCFPIPHDLIVCEGTRNTVLQIGLQP